MPSSTPSADLWVIPGSQKPWASSTALPAALPISRTPTADKTMPILTVSICIFLASPMTTLTLLDYVAAVWNTCRKLHIMLLDLMARRTEPDCGGR